MKKTTNNILKAMPQSQEAEQALLGSLLIDNEVAFNVLSSIAPTDFYFEANALIYECMQKIFRANKPIDYITLVDELENSNLLASIGGIEYITTLTNIVPSAVNYGSYLDIVKRTSILRQLISISKDIAEKAYDNPTKDEAIGYAEKLIYDLAQNEDTSDLEHIASSLKNVIDRFDRITKDKSMSKGILTGITELDNITNGLQNSDLILLAARPAVGKSSLGMQIINHAALNGKKCAVFTLEMSREQVAQRSLCSVACVDMKKALKGDLSIEEWKSLWSANKQLSESGIYIDDSSLVTPADILSRCRRLKREKGLDIVLIDYLQLMTANEKSKDSNRQQDVSSMTRFLKIAAKELNVPILLLSQLSRATEQRKENQHRPLLSDLRESGAIEQDADIVMFIHNPEAYGDVLDAEPNIREIIIAKHRNGETGNIKVRWIGEFVTFIDKNKKAPTKNTSYESNAPSFDPNELESMLSIPTEEE